MQNFSRRILHYEYLMCDYRCDYFLGICQAAGDEVAGFATEGVEVI